MFSQAWWYVLSCADVLFIYLFFSCNFFFCFCFVGRSFILHRVWHWFFFYLFAYICLHFFAPISNSLSSLENFVLNFGHILSEYRSFPIALKTLSSAPKRYLRHLETRTVSNFCLSVFLAAAAEAIWSCCKFNTFQCRTSVDNWLGAR